MKKRFFRSLFTVLWLATMLIAANFWGVFSASAATVDPMKTQDTDGDGLSDWDEIHLYHTNPNLADTDGDGYPDGEEVAHGYSPLVAGKTLKEVDSDGDGLSDWDEIHVYHTDPFNKDTDGDGYPDGEEVAHGYSPLLGQGQLAVNVDSDHDGLNDAWEIALGTDLLNPDTDGDGYPDGTEVMDGYDPSRAGAARLEKVIQVSLAKQTLTYSFGGKTLESFLISSGVKGMETPTGQFQVLDKVPVKHYGGPGYDLPNTKWNLHFTTEGARIYIHGAYWHHNWGHPMSHGCVNVPYSRMERLYDWAQVGTEVVINKK